MRQTGWFVLIAFLGGLVATAPTLAQSEEAARIKAATQVLQEIKDAPDVRRAAVGRREGAGHGRFPSVKKGGLVVGGEWGRGVMSAKSAKSGTWSSPAFLTLTGGSRRRADRRAGRGPGPGDHRRAGAASSSLSNQFKLGADAGVSAGPVGRNSEASTDIQMRAKILSYSRIARPVCRRDAEGVDDQAGSRRQRALLRAAVQDHASIMIDRLGGAPDPGARVAGPADTASSEVHGSMGSWRSCGRDAGFPMDLWTHAPMDPCTHRPLDPFPAVILPIDSQNSNICVNPCCFSEWHK